MILKNFEDALPVYKTIYADPPWPYWDKRTHASTGAVLSAYQTMELEEIKRLPVDTIAEKDATLLLWATMPKLPEALEVIKAWGFTYKTCAFVWVKLNPRGIGIYSGLGHWTNGNVELVLLANKGHPLRLRRDIKQVVIEPESMPEIAVSPRQRHSEKPGIVRKRIEQLFESPYVELFARIITPNWDSWGNEV
mgnify:CR=1 FL=1